MYKEIKVDKKMYRIPQKELENCINKLGISEKEAIELWLSDHDIIVNEQIEELTQKAKANRTDKIVVQSKAEKKKTERKPKDNPLKEIIINQIYKFLSEYNTISSLKITNKTKTIDFMIDNKDFSLNLVEHRKKKEK